GHHDALGDRLALGGRRRRGAVRGYRTETNTGVGGEIDRKRPSTRGDGMRAKRRGTTTGRARRSAGAAKGAARTARVTGNGSFETAIQRAVSGGGTVSVGLVNLV